MVWVAVFNQEDYFDIDFDNLMYDLRHIGIEETWQLIRQWTGRKPKVIGYLKFSNKNKKYVEEIVYYSNFAKIINKKPSLKYFERVQ